MSLYCYHAAHLKCILPTTLTNTTPQLFPCAVLQVVRYIDHLITMKLTRGERYAALLELQQKQMQWYKIIKCIQYALRVEPIANNLRIERNRIIAADIAARRVQVKFTSWYERRILLRYVNFLARVNDSMWRVRMHVNIWQKRTAARVIRTFLQERSQNQEVAKLVHSFLCGVRSIQRMARSYITCKINRVRALSILWEDLEEQYIMVGG